MINKLYKLTLASIALVNSYYGVSTYSKIDKFHTVVCEVVNRGEYKPYNLDKSYLPCKSVEDGSVNTILDSSTVTIGEIVKVTFEYDDIHSVEKVYIGTTQKLNN